MSSPAPPKTHTPVGTTDQGKGKGRSVVRPMGTAAYRGKGQGKGKGRGEGRLGQGGRGRSKGGEKPMGTTAYGGKGSKGRAANGDGPVGAASCRRDHHTMASCQPPPPPKGKVLEWPYTTVGGGFTPPPRSSRPWVLQVALTFCGSPRGPGLLEVARHRYTHVRCTRGRSHTSDCPISRPPGGSRWLSLPFEGKSR